MIKKTFFIFTLFIILFLNCSNVFALTINTNDNDNNNSKTNTTTSSVSNVKIESSKSTMELVDKSVCEIDLNNIGKFKKELTHFDKNKKEITINLTVTNTAKREEIAKPVEIYLVLDNSDSMEVTYQNKPKTDYVIQTASLFVDSLFEHFTNPKIGIVSFSSVDPISSTSSVSLGTENDAILLLPLSDSKETIKNTINSYDDKIGPYTNIEAGLSLAQSNFTNSTESVKYVVLISDGVPNLSLDTSTTLTYSGTTAINTKIKLQNMQTQGYHIFSVLMGLNESDINNPNAPVSQTTEKNMTYRELAEEIFGTVSNPTAGDFYFIDYDSLDTTVNGKIFNQITDVKDNTLKNIIIKDYFPQEIIDNFDFEHLIAPNFGTVTDEIDTADNSITWNIDVLKEGELATLSYKLKLKDKYNKSIVNVILPTNEKVDITFEDLSGKGNANSDVSPKVRVNYKEPVVPDNTISETPIPQTGNYSMVIIFAIIAISIFAISRILAIRKVA